MSELLLNASAQKIPLRAGSVDCIVTSPPYYGLRDYGVPGQLGLEETPEAYVVNMVTVFREVWRVMKPQGTLWLNIGDSYFGDSPTRKSSHLKRSAGGLRRSAKRVKDLKPKDLIGIPWMLAFALRAAGWYLRSDIIWSKPDPRPESVTDRPTKSHEYLFLLSKSPRYYYDADAIREIGKTDENSKAGHTFGGKKWEWSPSRKWEWSPSRKWEWSPSRNRRTVWEVATQPYAGAHFATFPLALVEPCIKAGCPEMIIDCDKCGVVLGYRNGTNAIYKLQELWQKMSGERSLVPQDGILWEAMRFFMDSKAQKNHEGLDNHDKGIQDDKNAITSPGEERWLHNGTPFSNGEGIGAPTKNQRSSAPHQRKQTGQQSIKSSVDEEARSRQPNAQTSTNEAHRMSSLWQENKIIQSCPKCSGNIRIRRGIAFDPFLGSGTVALAARMLGRNAIGTDLSFAYLHDQARQRMELDQPAMWEGARQEETNLDGLPLFQKGENS